MNQTIKYFKGLSEEDKKNIIRWVRLRANAPFGYNSSNETDMRDFYSHILNDLEWHE